MARIVGWQALLCLFLMLQLAATQDFRMLRRVDNSITTPTRSVSSPEPSSKHSVTGKTDEPKKADGSRGPVTTKAPDVTSSTSAIQTTPTVTASSSSENSPFFNSTIPAGHLPIQPVITPGWGVAGVILILTGLVYTLVGIKNRWINCFFSTAFLTALGISVLIVYIMTIPVSTAIQGAYVVAVTLSGCALGAASLIFKELTEGLGCAFGGFCLSMWFLCLAPGGLLHDTLGRAIFISCFSVGAFGFYFSRYTRDWAMIILMSFGGATVMVLGIDCYSRAGLKEFWAYIWNLNDDLFPLGADTYPITRGIRVETAAIVIICLIGVVSQVKLWKVVREKRERKAASLAEGQRHLEEEEEIVGRNIEAQAARERIEWEKVYAGRVLIKSNGSTESHYSNGTDGGSNNKNRRDRNSESVHTGSKDDCIEMTDLSDSNVAQSRASELIHFEMAKGGKVTVRVAADEVIEAPSDSEHGATNEEIPGPDTTRQNDDGSTSQNDEAEARRSSRRNHVTAVPEVVPLPFKVPTDDDLKSIGDRSSVATFADDEPIAPEDLPRDSLVRRVSQSSITLLRSLSQRKAKNVSPETQPKGGESSEELVDPKFTAQDDARSSVAATVDYESSTDDLQSSILGSDGRKSIEITAELGEAEGAPESKQMDDAVTETNDGKIHDDTPQEQPQQDIDEKASVARDPESTAAASNAVETRRLEPTDKATSLSSATSNLASLTKDRLPESLSRVALSFRTNEWTKHLSNAETPEPEAILIEPYATENDVEEAPRYVDIEDLQKTATGDVIPPSPAQRSKAQLIQGPALQPDSKGRKIRHGLSNVLVSAAEPLDALSPGASPGSSPTEVTMQPGSATMRRTSSGFAPIVEEQNGLRGASVPYPAEAMQQDNFQLNSTPFKPMVPRVVSFSNPNTLLGQRESVLRSRSQGNLVSHLAEMPVDTRGSVGDADSVYNYPAYNRAISPDPDDLPLNRRREMLRQSSSMTILPPSNLPPSNFRLNRSSSGIEVAGNTQFNSHQPKRDSSVSLVARETRLAHFRQSLAHDLQSTTPGVPPNMGRETPFASTTTLLDDMNTQRTVLIEKREAERQKREMQKREKEWHDRMFDSRMRSGDLLEAHREVIRKMQSSARDA
ncbi:hypothetical protein BBK36DRAFT_1179135 [Trichoderma citrinoviride]|uniref:TM7S3/TM198-like domain-containing protein n=1 Tax=Trichoderma citrinoviride TaxID=58853 RepID=A0A2T4B4T5_9HYPO|nr:hypothetical protein BBK36DRAFT_1179135 [Trichoderma citrinoviride]PTB64344.1 hypothetical protein BBK36DRAFT_1179135 [Trichoderma citrinoviride]